jgi:hypothetical protein
MRTPGFGPLLGAGLLACVACAQEPAKPVEPENWCRQETFLHESEFQVAEVSRASQLLGDNGSCPETADCRKGGEIASGSEVLVAARRFHGMACAWFQPADEVENVGWIPEANVKIRTPAPANESWTGAWNDRGHNWLYIDAVPDSPRLHIAGHARWYSGTDVIHFGRVNGDTTPGVAHLNVSEGDCTVYAHVVARYLVAVDNARCGGVSVRFDGVYQKRSPNAGYVPQVREGVVAASNVDLGQFTWSRLGGSSLSAELKEKLKPALGLRGEDAQTILRSHPLELTQDEAKSLTALVWNPLLNRLAAEFNRSKTAPIPEFGKLPGGAQTTMADLAITFGVNFGAADRQNWGSDPKLWELLTRGNWTEAAAELRAKAAQLRRNFPRKLGDRLDADADLLVKITP